MVSLTEQEKEVIKKKPIGGDLGLFYKFFSDYTMIHPPTSSNPFKDIISSVGQDEGTFF